jgi:hypothetical protein
MEQQTWLIPNKKPIGQHGEAGQNKQGFSAQ